MIKIIAVVIISVFTLVFSGCQGIDFRPNSTPEASSTDPLKGTIAVDTDKLIVQTPNNTLPTLVPYVFGESDAGYATIHGHIFVTNINIVQPDPNDAVFLVPYSENADSGIPAIKVGEVPQAEVDERTGEFLTTNIEPGTYVVVVLMKSGAQMPAFTMDYGNLAIVRVTESDLDQMIELDYLRVP